MFKKKTVFWLSVWDGFIRTSFYFTEKTKPGVLSLNIDDELKQNLESAKPIGKLIPLVFDIVSDDQLVDFYEIVKYKKGLK
ncbi:DUF3788 family protein [Geofilum rubicundum]|uniref:Uncharacterized protein n=1 Tax=Geofilum rubicundum JCM 15548 TaxID=1236989 RepID=A0A0E9LSN4_9BACT|nr:hypothetical protein JCM15548_1695 [Geofilum rubicundum JCM 15548]